MVAVSYYKTENVFNYTWLQVVQAYWHRYPNPSSTHVLTEDTIRREVRDGKLYTRRLLSKTNAVPKWGERFYKNTPVKIIEDSVLDPKEKTLITFTRNIGLKKIMRVDEIVEYSQQHDGCTLAVRRAYISSQVFGFSRAIRAFGIERFKSNCHKAANGFNYVLRNMFPKHVALENGALMNSDLHLSTMPTTTTTTTTITTVATTSSSRADALKKASRVGYEYLKCQVGKMAQLFSIKN